MPKIGAGFLARKREARPSPENLPPGEGRGGAAAMLKSKPKGRGITRPAQSRRRRKAGDTALGAVFQGCGGGPAVPVLLSFFERCSSVSRLREPRTAPQRSQPVRAHRHGPRRPWTKARTLARRDRAPAMRTARMGRDVAGASRSAGWSLRSAVTRPQGGSGALIQGGLAATVMK